MPSNTGYATSMRKGRATLKAAQTSESTPTELTMTVFHKDGSAAEHMHFCSWKCCVKALRKVKTDYFISLPFLHYDGSQKGLGAQDFFALLK